VLGPRAPLSRATAHEVSTRYPTMSRR
jgi:hypothetical protein